MRAVEEVIVVCGCDDQYAMPTAVTLYSLVKHISPRFSVRAYILSLGLSEENKARICKSVESTGMIIKVIYIEVDNSLVEPFPLMGHLSSAVYLRIFIPRLLPAEIDKVLYLDTDVLIRKDVSPLWAADVEDNYLLAAIDPYTPNVASSNGICHWKELNIPEPSYCFNSGVMLINVSKWRKECLTKKLIHYVETHKHVMRHHDQEALNAVCFRSWGQLEMTWNAIPSQLTKFSDWGPSQLRDYIAPRLRELQKSPCICHFTTKKKPWIPGYRMPFQIEWLLTLLASRWFSKLEFSLWLGNWIVLHLSRGFKHKVLRSAD